MLRCGVTTDKVLRQSRIKSSERFSCVVATKHDIAFSGRWLCTLNRTVRTISITNFNRSVEIIGNDTDCRDKPDVMMFDIGAVGTITKLCLQ